MARKRPIVAELVTTSIMMAMIGTATTPFEYAARLTEVMLLGVVAMRAGVKIHYDGANMKVTNSKDANDLLKREYRRGFSL